MSTFRRSVAFVTAVCLASTGLMQSALATSISTEQMVATTAQVAAGSVNHQRLHAALDRQDLATALQARGVAPDELRARVNALTDAEAAQLTAQIDAAPAGGEVLGVLFSIFVILLVTDILGFTKVFPFTRSSR